MKKFTIVEKHWARGGKNGESRLKNADGNKCCLGFLAEAVGEECSTGFMPHDLPEMCVKFPEFCKVDENGKVLRGSDLAYEIAQINDKERAEDYLDDPFTDEERKEQLAPLFAKIGWEPEYV